MRRRAPSRRPPTAAQRRRHLCACLAAVAALAAASSASRAPPAAPAPLEFHPASAELGAVRPGASGVVHFRVVNTSPRDVTLESTGVRMDAAFGEVPAGWFEVTTGRVLPTVIPPGQNLSVDVQFLPTLALGSGRALLEARGNGTSALPAVVNVGVVGSHPFLAGGGAVNGPLVAVAGGYAASASGPTLTNDGAPGSQMLGVFNWTVGSVVAPAGHNASHQVFAVASTPATPAELAPDKHAVGSVTFTPDVPGDYHATILIVTDAQENTTLGVRVNGTAVPSPVFSVPTDVTMPHVDYKPSSTAQEQSHTQFTLRNSGTTPLSVTGTFGGDKPGFFAVAYDHAGNFSLDPGAAAIVTVTSQPDAPNAVVTGDKFPSKAYTVWMNATILVLTDSATPTTPVVVACPVVVPCSGCSGKPAHHGPRTAYIVGGIVGGMLAVILLGWCLDRRTRSKSRGRAARGGDTGGQYGSLADTP